MARLCERPGCSQGAEFLYAIDAEHLTVWLEPFESGGSDRAGVLCRRHADAMVVPLGWMLDDRRAQAPQLFRTLSSPSVASAGDRSRRQRAGTPAAVEVLQLSLDAAQESAAVEESVAIDEAVAIDESVAIEAVDAVDARGVTASADGADMVDPTLDESVPSDGEVTPPIDTAVAADPAATDSAATDSAGADDASAVLPWRPVFDQSDDLDGLLTASSPLLRRAFGRNPPPVG